MDVTIEPARVRDAEHILKLQYLCYQSEAALYDDDSIPPLTQTLAVLLAEYDTHCIRAALVALALTAALRACHIQRAYQSRTRANRPVYVQLGRGSATPHERHKQVRAPTPVSDATRGTQGRPGNVDTRH